METVTAHGAAIPTIGLGTWPMKGEECVAAVAAALRDGYRHLDTAAAYQNEEQVGEGLRASGVARDEVFVTTKVWHTDLAEGDMQRAAEQSLRRLGLDAVDLLLIHWPSLTLPVAATIRTLNDVRRQGLARHIGVSNFTTALLDEAWAATDEPLVANQCEYHPCLGQAKVLAATRARGMAFVAYAPLGRGDLLADPAIQAVAARHRRTPAQVALRWLVQQDGVVAIPKSADPRRIAENMAVFDFALDADEISRLSALARPDGRIILDPQHAPVWDD